MKVRRRRESRPDRFPVKFKSDSAGVAPAGAESTTEAKEIFLNERCVRKT